MIHIFINILIFTLIFVFIIILKQQLFMPYSKIENFKNNNTNTNRNKNSNPYKLDEENAGFILAQQNAGNINILKDRVGHLEVLKNQVIDNSNKIKLLEVSLEEILQEQRNFTSQHSQDNIIRHK